MSSQAYAMTEASHQMTSNPLPKHGARKPGTVGRAQGSVKVSARSAAHTAQHSTAQHSTAQHSTACCA